MSITEPRTAARKTTRYVTSRDDATGLWYVHLEGFPYVPVFGSFRKTKRAAQRIAMERNLFL